MSKTKKIITKIVYQNDKAANDYKFIESEHYLYNGNVALCSGGGGGDVTQNTSGVSNTQGSSDTTAHSETEPWAPQKLNLIRGFNEAANLFLDSAPPELYQGRMTVPYAPETETALQLGTLRALMGSPVQSAANDQLTSTLSGNYMANNPTIRGDYLFGGQGFNAAVDAASRKIIPQVDSTFNAGGRLHSGLAEQAKTQALSDSFAGLYDNERNRQEQSYAQERQNQIRSMLFAPTVAAQDYQDLDRLGAVGSAREDMAQKELAERIQRQNYAQNIMQMQLQQFIPLIQGNYGGTTDSESHTDYQQSTQSQQNSTTSGGGGGGGNPFLGAIGGALSGFSGASSAGMNPLLGGALGLLGGLF